MGERVYTQLYFHGGRSVTRLPSTQSESACRSRSLPLGLSAPGAISVSVLCTATTPVSALLQPCSHATVSPRAPGGALYIESIVTYCPHVCSELADQGQVRILATGTFTLSTTHHLPKARNSSSSPAALTPHTLPLLYGKAPSLV